MSKSSRLANRGQGFVATALLASFFLALLLGSSPQLHARIHSDASQPDHVCAVSLIASGSFDHGAPPTILVSNPAVEFSNLPVLAPVWVQSLFLKAHIFAHAPPLAA